MTSGRQFSIAVFVVVICSVALAQLPAQVGDIYVGICDGTSTTSDETDVFTAGGLFVNAFHGPSQSACVTRLMFDVNNHLREISAPLGTQSWRVLEFDDTGAMLSNKGPFTSPISMAHDNHGNIYLGQGTILKIAPNGATTTYSVAGGARYIALATDQHTMFYTVANGDVKSYDLATRTQGIDIARNAIASTIRVLPDNSLLLDSLGAVQRWVPACDGCAYRQVSAYQIPANADSFALDPDGISLWSINTYMDLHTSQGRGDVFRTNIKTGDAMGSFSLPALDNGRYYAMSIGVNGDGSTSSVTVTPTSLTYRARLIGTVSSGKRVTLTNTGAVQVVLSNTTITGDFAVKRNGCLKGIAPGASCTIGITFTPTQVGSRNGVLKIFDNTATSPQTVTLSGVGE